MIDILVRIPKLKIHTGENMTQLNGSSPTPKATTEHNEAKPQTAKGALLHELAEHRHDPEFIAQSFRSGEYPYKTKISKKTYETQKNRCRLSYLKYKDGSKKQAKKWLFFLKVEMQQARAVPLNVLWSI
jgi:hypothetical protein